MRNKLNKSEMPDHLIIETICLNPDLKNAHGKAAKLSGEHLKNYLIDNPDLLDSVKDKHLARLEHHFGHDSEMLAHAHEHGISATYKKIKDAKDKTKSEGHYFRRRWAFPDDEAGLQKADGSAIPKHNDKIRAVADSYAAKKGIKLDHDAKAPKVDQEHATSIAGAYDAMPHDPQHPAVKKAYGALIGETMDQFNHIKSNGLKTSKIKPGQVNPYKTSKDLHTDLADNNHMWYYPTETAFGSGESGSDHPMLAQIGHKDEEGKPFLANDAFRVVHDYFGHGKEGSGFGSGGEENAWAHHKQMYSPEAQKALTTETRGQNSWVNFGPHGKANRANPANTIYAPQKAGLLPDFAHGPASTSHIKENPKG